MKLSEAKDLKVDKGHTLIEGVYGCCNCGIMYDHTPGVAVPSVGKKKSTLCYPCYDDIRERTAIRVALANEVPDN